MTHPSFSHMPLPRQVQEALLEKDIWSPKCPISLNRLNLVQFSFHDFHGHMHHDGSMVVLDILAPYVENLFRHLFLMRFPLQSAKRIEFFDGDDERSMQANNSSAFNFRAIAGTSTLSLHSYGAAIDINPLQNPCLCHPQEVPDSLCSTLEVWPMGGVEYLNRRNQRPGMVESIVDAFHEAGFRDWGGAWNDLVDYHHFQLLRPLAELLAVMSKHHGEAFYRAYVENRITLEGNEVSSYQKDPEGFMEKLRP